MVKRNIVRFSKNGYGCPYVRDRVEERRGFGNAERSATIGGCRYSRTIDGLYAQYRRNGAFTTGSITCSSSPVEARSFCVPGAILTCPSKPACGNCVFRSFDAACDHGELVGAQDLVDAGVEERRQRHRPDDRDAVFEIDQQLRVAARRDELIGRHRHRDRRVDDRAAADDLLGARACRRRSAH